MPLQTILPFVGMGMDILSTGANALMNASNNRAQRAFANEMYAKQRTDSLSDWNMQNFYNSPAEQMKRLKEAGLNPNLVYGNGAVQSQAGTPRPASASNPSTNPSRVESPNVMGVYDLAAKKADMDYKVEAIENLRKDRELRDTQILETKARIPGYPIRQAMEAYNLEWQKTMAPIRKAQEEANVASTTAGTAIALNANDRANIAQSWTIAEAIERILSARLGRDATRSIMAKTNVETAIQQEQLKLWKDGINPNDPLWMRKVVELLNDGTLFGNPVKSLLQKANEGIKNAPGRGMFKNIVPRTFIPKF